MKANTLVEHTRRRFDDLASLLGSKRAATEAVAAAVPGLKETLVYRFAIGVYGNITVNNLDLVIEGLNKAERSAMKRDQAA